MPFIATSRRSGSKAADGRPDRGEHASPVRVVAEQGALEQVVAGDAASDLDGVVLVGGADDLDAHLLGGALGVGEQLCGQVCGDVVQRGGEIGGVGRDAGCAAAQQQHGVVGRHAAVGVDAVERAPGRRPQRLVGGERVDHGVGGEHAQHRREARREHAGALGHAADRPAVDGDRRLLADGVGRADRVRSVGAAVGRERACGRGDAGEQRRHRQPFADQSGRADGDLARADAERGGDRFGAAVGVGESVRAGARVRAAGVQHDGTQPLVGDDLLGPQHRRGLDPVGREHGGRDVGRTVVDDQREVERARLP